MQTINGNVTDFGLDAKATTLSFTLVNRFLKPIKEVAAKTLLTQSDGSFSIALLENDTYPTLTFYKITVQDDAVFSKTIYIPFSSKPSLHIQCLKQTGGCENVVTYVRADERYYEISERFIEKMESFFKDKSIYLARTQQELLKNFIQFADETDETKKCDVCHALDVALANYIKE